MELNEDDLVFSFKTNCNSVEKIALNTVLNHDICIFGLQQYSAKDCYNALCKFKSCFGSTVNVERCLCLIMLTDYISCAIANSSFYSSFNVKYSEKFLTQLFNRLNREWVFIYSAKHAFLTTERLEHIVNLLRSSVVKLLPFQCAKVMTSNLEKCEMLYEQYKRNETNIVNPVDCYTSVADKIQNTEPFEIHDRELNNNVEMKHDILSDEYDLLTKNSTSNNICQDKLFAPQSDIPKSSYFSEKIDENTSSMKKCLSTENLDKSCMLKTAVENNIKRVSGMSKLKNISNIKCYTVPLSQMKTNVNSNITDLPHKTSTIVVTEEKPAEEKDLLKKKLNAFDILMQKSRTIKRVNPL